MWLLYRWKIIIPQREVPEADNIPGTKKEREK